jgi:hypothetical protein
MTRHSLRPLRGGLDWPLDTFHGRETKFGPEHPHTIESLKQLVTLYESWPKPDEAAKWRAKLAETKATEE